MSYRILKLRSGESIIAKIIESKNNQVSIENPMIMNVMTIPDPFLKFKREVLTLSNWLEYSKTKEVTIPEDWIALCLTPDAQTTKLYIAEVNQPDVTKEDMMREQTMREDIMKQAEENLRELEDELKNLTDMPDMPNIPNSPSSSVFMSFSMNHDMFKKLIEEGLLDQEMDDEFDDPDGEQHEELERENKHRTGSEDDFGNDWVDWSPDLRDYL
jgi:NACalpha-BTF3-like transcription factor